MATTPPTPPTEETQPLRLVRARALVLAFLLCVPVTYAVTNAGHSSIFSLIVAPVSALLALIIVNIPLRLFLPKAALSQSDLVLIFALVAVAGSVAGEWTGISHAQFHQYPLAARTDPTFKDKYMVHIPDWLATKDLEQVKDIEGGGKPWTYVVGKLPVFLPLYVAWAVPFLAICFAMLCINSLMRGAWNERERLTFPLIQLPVAMAEGGGAGGMWRSRHMWIAFAAMFAIDMLNGLNYLYPNLPSIPVKELFNLQEAFKEPPLSNIGHFRIAIFPFMAAIGLFMPSDLLVSFVAFFLLRKGLHVAIAAGGIPQSTFSGTAIAPGPPYFDEQTWGAVIAMFLGAMWSSRDYLKEVWRDIRRGRRSEDGGLAHRWAFVGLLACSAVVVGFGVVGGLPPIYMIVYFALFLVFSIVLTRIRAQLGPPTHEFAFFGTNTIMHRFLGNRWLSEGQATYLSQGFLILNRIYRNHPMP